MEGHAGGSESIERALRANELTEKHADWIMEWIENYPELNAGNIHTVMQDEIGKIFVKVLECAGVYKRDAAGQEAFKRFTRSL